MLNYKVVDHSFLNKTERSATPAPTTAPPSVTASILNTNEETQVLTLQQNNRFEITVFHLNVTLMGLDTLK